MTRVDAGRPLMALASAARRWQRRAATWGARSCTPTSSLDGPVYDLMELYRPAVDALVLALLARTTLTFDDVVQGRARECGLHPHLARAATWPVQSA
jgi:hypothetical protein